VADGELEDEVDDRPFRAPLPLADRLWRHPSELDDEGQNGVRLPRLLAAFFSRPRP